LVPLDIALLSAFLLLEVISHALVTLPLD